MKESKIDIRKFNKDRASEWPYYDVWCFQVDDSEEEDQYWDEHWEDGWVPPFDSANPIYDEDLIYPDDLNGLDRAANLVGRVDGVSRRIKKGY